MSSTDLKLSVIIATYNRSASLLRTLRSFISQTAEPAAWEIVVINNNSADDTDTIVQQFAAHHPQIQLRLFTETQQGLSPARNRGIKESRGEYLAIIDDDEEINTDFIKTYIEFFDRRSEAVAAGGKIIPRYEYKVPRWLSPLAERPIGGNLDLGEHEKPFPGNKYPGGGNMGIRKSAIEKVGLFDPALGRTGTSLLGGEEKDLFERLKKENAQIWYLPDAIIYHLIPEEKLTPDYFDRVNYMTGKSERLRTLNESRTSYLKRLVTEGIKWVAACIFCLGYTLKFQPEKGWFLLRMRWQISKGLIG